MFQKILDLAKQWQFQEAQNLMMEYFGNFQEGRTFPKELKSIMQTKGIVHDFFLNFFSDFMEIEFQETCDDVFLEACQYIAKGIKNWEEFVMPGFVQCLEKFESLDKVFQRFEHRFKNGSFMFELALVGQFEQSNHDLFKDFENYFCKNCYEGYEKCRHNILEEFCSL